MKRKRSFKPAALILILAMAVIPVFAQSGQGQGQGQGQRGGRQMSEEDVKKRVGILADTLELTDKQEKQIIEFEMEYYKTIQKERASFDPETSDRDAMRARMGELRDERDGKYKAVLTEKQFVNYTKMAEERREQMRKRRGESQDQGSDGQRNRGKGGN